MWPGSGYSGWILEGQEGHTGTPVDHAEPKPKLMPKLMPQPMVKLMPRLMPEQMLKLIPKLMPKQMPILMPKMPKPMVMLIPTPCWPVPG